MTTSLLEKISLLLNKAEGTDNEHEREAFMQKAQELATREQIDIEQARNLQGNKSTSKLISKTFMMGERRTPGLFTKVELFNRIAVANDVKIAVAQNSTCVLAYGYDTDIAVVEALFTSLLLQMTSECEAYIAKGEYKLERVWRDGYWENYGGSRGREWVEAGYKPMHATTAKNSFRKAYALRVGARLSEARRNAVRQAETASTGSELVLRSKAATVSNFFDTNANARGSYKGGQGAVHSSHASGAGRAAADRANLGNTNLGSKKGQLG